MNARTVKRRGSFATTSEDDDESNFGGGLSGSCRFAHEENLLECRLDRRRLIIG